MNKIIYSGEKKQEKDIKTKNSIKKLEQFYVDGKVDDMLSVLNQRKEEITQDMINYAKSNNKACKWDKEGNPLDYKVDYNPLVVSNMYFKSIVPINCRIPMYNAEKLGIVYEYYMYLITEVNDKIGKFAPSLAGFCKMAGISMNTLKTYKNSADIDMRNLVDMIYDQIGDENLTMSQLGMASERSTMFKLKSQNEMVEKVNPNVNITYREVINTDKINDNLNKYKSLLGKKE